MNQKPPILVALLLLIPMEISMNAPALSAIGYQNQDSAAISIGNYQKQDAAQRAKTLNSILTRSVAEITARLRSLVDSDGKSKSEAQIDRDRERAVRIENIIRNGIQAKLGEVISRAGKDDPNDNLGRLVMKFIRREIFAPEAETITCGELSSTVDIDTRDDILFIVVNHSVASLLANLNSPVDSKEQPKSEQRLQRDRERADLVRQIRDKLISVGDVTQESRELAVRMSDAGTRQPNDKLADIMRGYFADEVRERMQTKPPSQNKQ